MLLTDFASDFVFASNRTVSRGVAETETEACKHCPYTMATNIAHTAFFAVSFINTHESRRTICPSRTSHEAANQYLRMTFLARVLPCGFMSIFPTKKVGYSARHF